MSLLGIDIGTSGCKAAAFSADGRCHAMAHREYATLHPGPGLAELNSLEVWNKTREIISAVAAATVDDPVSALCVSSIGEALVPVNDRREILGNSIICTDARGAEYAASLAAYMDQESFYRINPNIQGPQYSLPKLMWIRENQPELFARSSRFLLWGDLVPFMLGCEAFAVNSLANRTLLFDMKLNDWSGTLLKWSGIDRQKLGQVISGGVVIGTIPPDIAAGLNLPPGVKVVSGGHDQCCNALGCGCINPGMAVCGLGTFECITPCYSTMPDPASMIAEGLNSEHHVLPGLYVSFLFNQAGALMKWFRDTFASELADSPNAYGKLNSELPQAPARLLTLPHFTPPLWPRNISCSAGVIAGLRTDTTRGEIMKSIMESETFYFMDGLQSLERMGMGSDLFIATGGGAKSDAWLQIKADITGKPFVRPRISEGSLLGAAMLAGIATSCFSTAREAVSRFVAYDRTFHPNPANHTFYKERVALFRELYPSVRQILKSL